MNNQTHLHDDDKVSKLVNDISEGINDAGTTFPSESDPVQESNVKQGIRYILWGLISVVVNIGTFYLLFQIFRLNYQFANIVAWVLSVQVGFWVDREIVFRHKSDTAIKEMTAFYGTRIFTYLIEALTLWVGISLLSANGNLSKIVGQFLAIVGNYVFSKFFIFANHNTGKKSE
ncbi:GtrA family protein [Companilactobacillus sp.]|jgi:putative flippase GtrA|uniref:GtrA family protein n=1 Tax=Companilactobacillus sp. TaxID=2767905 RepID=UPI0025BF83F2|nr:GtrA family protein [Companilactobacillus sp.]MCH4009093.1 GtrA family protein [Companilactobacillus sp.]MCH4050728.1 GtrA family protein [Companilactobacillus sp.]MCH4077035.1 GtrA family protein [Companilactobacillus sp.]MCH4125611.1 GtrA family protein [Companilactobacillus sp.]MCI1311320.1 GtrA family protein [Companilactobacillus sp.]